MKKIAYRLLSIVCFTLAVGLAVFAVISIVSIAVGIYYYDSSGPWGAYFCAFIAAIFMLLVGSLFFAGGVELWGKAVVYDDSVMPS